MKTIPELLQFKLCKPKSYLLHCYCITFDIDQHGRKDEITTFITMMATMWLCCDQPRRLSIMSVKLICVHFRPPQVHFNNGIKVKNNGFCIRYSLNIVDLLNFEYVSLKPNTYYLHHSNLASRKALFPKTHLMLSHIFLSFYCWLGKLLYGKYAL